MFFFSLDVRCKDNATDQLIASGAFRHGVFHNFPDRRVTALGVVDSVYSAK